MEWTTFFQVLILGMVFGTGAILAGETWIKAWRGGKR